jgi:hypothetical protein
VPDGPEAPPGVIPSPKLVAAWVALDVVDAEEIPLLAAHWLAGGYDGESLVTLAGFSGTDPREVHDVLPDALADCGAPIPDLDQAYAHTAFFRLACMHAAGRAGERWIAEKIDELLDRDGYPPSALDLPMGHLCRLAGEWGVSGGRSEQQLTADVRDACAAQLAMSLTTPAPPYPDEEADVPPTRPG